MFVPVKSSFDKNLWTVGYYTNGDEGLPVFIAMKDFRLARRRRGRLSTISMEEAVFTLS